jgi:hypothetical protein
MPRFLMAAPKPVAVQPVAWESDEEGVGVHYFPGDVDGLVEFAGDGDLVFGVAEQAVGHDEGRADGVDAETLAMGLHDVLDAVVAFAFVEGGGFREEGDAAFSFDPVHEGADEFGFDAGVVLPFADMDLDGDKIVRGE